MSRAIDVALVAICGGALVVGSYQAGKLAERRWWRAELASKNAEVRATMAKLGTDADALDATLLNLSTGYDTLDFSAISSNLIVAVAGILVEYLLIH